MRSMKSVFIISNFQIQEQMKSSCLYHQLKHSKTDLQENSQRSQRSLQKQIRHRKQNSQNKRIHEPSYYQPAKEEIQFNDYTIYPSNGKDKKINRQFFRKQQKTTEENFFIKEIFKTEQFQKQNCLSRQKSIKSKCQSNHSQQKYQKSLFQVADKDTIKYQKLQKKYKKSEQAIQNLQNQIHLFNQRLALCESETKKNHYEYQFLRNVVQKIRISHLEIDSRQFVLQNMKKNDPTYKARYQDHQNLANNQNYGDHNKNENFQSQQDFNSRKHCQSNRNNDLNHQIPNFAKYQPKNEQINRQSVRNIQNQALDDWENKFMCKMKTQNSCPIQLRLDKVKVFSPKSNFNVIYQTVFKIFNSIQNLFKITRPFSNKSAIIKMHQYNKKFDLIKPAHTILRFNTSNDNGQVFKTQILQSDHLYAVRYKFMRSEFYR